MKNEMSRLDTDLTVEIKRRTEMNKSTQIVSPHTAFQFIISTTMFKCYLLLMLTVV